MLTMKEELIEFIRENLTIRINSSKSWYDGDTSLEVSLILGNEVISSYSTSIKEGG